MTTCVYSNGDYAVIWDGATAEITRQKATHAQTIEAYSGDSGGLSIAICRCMWLAGTHKAGSASEALALAREIVAMGPRKAHNKWLEQ